MLECRWVGRQSELELAFFGLVFEVGDLVVGAEGFQVVVALDVVEGCDELVCELGGGG